MMRFLSNFIVGVLLILPTVADSNTSGQIDLSDQLRNKIRVIQHFALNPVIVKAVKRDIEALEVQAMEPVSELPIQDDMTDVEGLENGELGQAEQSEEGIVPSTVNLEHDHHLIMRKFIETHSSFREIYLMDNEAAEVEVYPEASDFLNEEKRQQVVSDAGAQVYIGPITLDKKTRKALTYISAPVFDRDNKIGTLLAIVQLETSQRF